MVMFQYGDFESWSGHRLAQNMVVRWPAGQQQIPSGLSLGLESSGWKSQLGTQWHDKLFAVLSVLVCTELLQIYSAVLIATFVIICSDHLLKDNSVLENQFFIFFNGANRCNALLATENCSRVQQEQYHHHHSVCISFPSIILMLIYQVLLTMQFGQ